MAARRGHHAGGYEVLSRDQELDLIEALRGTYPDQVGLEGELWSRPSVVALVERLYGITLSPAAIGRYLTAWGLGPREPAERACALCVDAVVRWVERAYPAIVRSAQEHDAELCWIGRTRLHGVAPAAPPCSATPTDTTAARVSKVRSPFLVIRDTSTRSVARNASTAAVARSAWTPFNRTSQIEA